MRAAKVLSTLVLLASSVVSQNATELLQQLEEQGLTSFVNATTTINTTSTGQSLLAQLDSGPFTVFAPNNDAWAGAFPNVTGDAEALAAALSYHIVPGTFNTTASYPNTTIGRTLLNSSNYSFLEGGRSQVLAWTDVDGTLTILNQNTPNVVVNSTIAGNITVHVTNAVIDFPGDLNAALFANNLTQFTNITQEVGVLDTLNTVHGVTIFAPSDEAFAAAQQSLDEASSNETVVTNILRNHIINGTSVYTGNLIGLGDDSNLTTAGGQGLSAVFNETGGYVSVGNTTALITTPDIILWNGVLHIIDTVLLDETSDEEAASSAVSSASEAATSSVTESGPVGFTPSPTEPEGAAATSSSASMEVPLRFARRAGMMGVAFGGVLAM